MTDSKTTGLIWFMSGTVSEERHYSADKEQMCRLFDRRNRFAGGMSSMRDTTAQDKGTVSAVRSHGETPQRQTKAD